MITVRLPYTLRDVADDTLQVDGRIGSIAELIEAIDQQVPGFKAQLDDSVFNFAVNDEMLLYRARGRALNDGDIVEVIPTISGG